MRFSLWDDLNLLKETVLEFMKYANIIKISDEELAFITGCNNINEAKDSILKDNCELLIYTKGKDGAEIFTKNNHLAIDGLNVKAIDTTGAGDSFIGAFIYQLLKNKDYYLANIPKERLEEYLKFANYYGAYMTSVEGALASLADQKTIDEFIKLVNS